MFSTTVFKPVVNNMLNTYFTTVFKTVVKNVLQAPKGKSIIKNKQVDKTTCVFSIDFFWNTRRKTKHTETPTFKAKYETANVAAGPSARAPLHALRLFL